MATLGGSSKRQKICYDNNGIQACNEFFSVTNLDTNQTEWHQDTTWRAGGMHGLQGPESSKIIGHYDPKTKKFTPTDEAYASQKKHFTSPAGTKEVADNIIKTNTKSLIENGLSPEEAEKKARDISNNKPAPSTKTGENGDTTTGDTTTGDGDTKDIVDDNKDKTGTNKDFGKDLRYPITMSDTQDTLKIDMVEYTAKGFKPKGSNWGGADRSKAGEGDRKIIGTVVLPIPGGIKDADKEIGRAHV